MSRHLWLSLSFPSNFEFFPPPTPPHLSFLPSSSCSAPQPPETLSPPRPPIHSSLRERHLQHHDHVHFFLRVDPEVGAARSRPEIISNRTGYGRMPHIGAHCEAQSKALSQILGWSEILRSFHLCDARGVWRQLLR